ncbi:Hypothetical protein PBC10988_37520 [Planctomycetales bacterium 10988]|nr:Hypothetical protein PBC10988_37520 [Planctomycetales bacterium 10988]
MSEKEADFNRFMVLLKEGDPDTIAHFLEEFEPFLQREIRVARRYSRYPHLLDSQDLCQSTLVRFVQALPQLSENHPKSLDQLKGYLAKILRNRFIDELRKIQVRQTALDRWLQEDSNTPFTQEPTPSETLQVQDNLDQLAQVLSAEDLSALEQRLQGKSWREIGESMDGCGDTIRKRIQRLSRKLFE